MAQFGATHEQQCKRLYLFSPKGPFYRIMFALAPLKALRLYKNVNQNVGNFFIQSIHIQQGRLLLVSPGNSFILDAYILSPGSFIIILILHSCQSRNCGSRNIFFNNLVKILRLQRLALNCASCGGRMELPDLKASAILTPCCPPGGCTLPTCSIYSIPLSRRQRKPGIISDLVIPPVH